MITEKENKTVNTKYCFRTLYNTDKPSYIKVYNDVWIPFELNMPTFTDEARPFALIRNVLSTRSISYYWFNWFMDYGNIHRGENVFLYSTRNFQHAFGASFTKPTKIAMYDASSWRIITDWEEIPNQPLNDKHFLIYQNVSSDANYIHWEFFCVLFNGVTYQKIIPKYEKLIPPTYACFFAIPLYEKIRKLEIDETLTIHVPKNNDNLPDTYTLYPLRLVIWANDNFYTYNSGTGFTKFNLSDVFITRDEILANGFTLEEFNAIADEDWDILLADTYTDIFVYTCGYMLPSVIEGRYWKERLDINNFLWVKSKRKNYIIMSGEI